MSEEGHRPQKVLYVISCGSPVAQRVPEFVTQAQGADWKVCTIPMLRRYGIRILYKPEVSPLQQEYPMKVILDELKRHVQYEHKD